MWLRSFFHRSQSVQKKRRTPCVLSRRRPHFETLEDRLTLSFAYWGAFTPLEFNQLTGPDAVVAGEWPAVEQLQLNSADFNADGWNDLFRVTLSEPGFPHLGQIFLTRADGTFDAPMEFDPGPDPRSIATGDFDLGSFDGRADFAIYVLYGHGDRHELEILIDSWYMYRNMGNWPVVGPELAGDFNRDGTVDAADYVTWRNSPNDFGGDPGGYNLWRTNFGQTIVADAAMNADSNFAVPEPGGLALVTFAVPALVRRRKGPRTGSDRAPA
jgi:hypothetical protein